MRRLQDRNEQAMTSREGTLNGAAAASQDGAGDDKVGRLGRSAGDAKDTSPHGEVAPPAMGGGWWDQKLASASDGGNPARQ